jgi:hypothetical protein
MPFLLLDVRLLDAPPQHYQVDPFAFNTASPNTQSHDEFSPKLPTYNDISNEVRVMT